MSTKIIVMSNNKGGVGKTSSVAALGDVLARKLGKKVLLIDADEQGNLSHLFGYGVDSTVQNTLGAFLQSEFMYNNGTSKERLQPSLFFNEATYQRPTAKVNPIYKNLRIMCTHGELRTVYKSFENDIPSSEFIIFDFLNGLKESGEFDYVLIDTNPHLDTILGYYIVASDYLMTPMPAGEFAISGAENLMELFKLSASKKARYRTNSKLDFLGFFFCETTDKGVADKLYRQNKGELWNEKVFFDTSIPKTVDVLNAENRGAPVTAVFPTSPASWNYVKLARELEDRIQKAEEGTLYE